ncbi:MAG: phage portal protein [Solirubrobacteraceae bacterium]
MSWRETLRSFLPWTAEARDVTSGLADAHPWLIDALGGGRTIAGERITVQTALAIDAVFACVNLIAGSVAALPLAVYRGQGNGRQRAYTDPRWRMLHDSPNPEQPADVVQEHVMAHVLLWGNAYLEKIRRRSTGVVEELWPILPSRVVVERDERDRKVFIVDGRDELTIDDVLHVPGFGYDGLKGMSVIGFARDVLGNARARTRFEGEFYENDATPGGVLSVDGELDDEAAERIARSWENAHKGAGHRHRIAVLEAGAKWQAVGMPLKDLEYVARERLTAQQIARYFNVAPELIGADRQHSMTYSNTETQGIQFLQFTLSRWLRRYEGALKHDPTLFPEPDVYPEFIREAMLRTDHRTRWEVYEIGHRIGVWSPNDIRAKENEPPREGGDAYAENLPGAAPSDPAGAGEGEGEGRALNGNGHREVAAP